MGPSLVVMPVWCPSKMDVIPAPPAGAAQGPLVSDDYADPPLFLIKFIFIKKQLLAGFLLALFQVFSIFGKSFPPSSGSIERSRMICAGDITLDNKE
ncbi:hypothetical protein ACK3Y8_13755 [Aeromonas caviae]